jgi:hypothetical protein
MVYYERCDLPDPSPFAAVGFTIPAILTVTLGAMEDQEKSTPRSSVYKGEVVLHEKTKLIMKDSNGQRIELLLDEDTLIQGRPGAPFRPGDPIEADVTPGGAR